MIARLRDATTDPPHDEALGPTSPHEWARARKAWAQHLERLRADREAEDEALAIEYEARNRHLLSRCGGNVVLFPVLTADQHRHLLRALSERRDAEPCWFRDDADWYGVARPTAPRLHGWSPDIDPTFLTETVLAMRRDQARARISELRRTPRRPKPKPRRLKLRNRPASPNRLKLRRRD